MDDLRLALILLGASLVGAIYLWETYRRRRSRKDSAHAGAESELRTDGPSTGQPDTAPGEDTVELGDLAALEKEPSTSPVVGAEARPDPGAAAAPSAASPALPASKDAVDMIVSLALMARPGLRLPGDEVRGAFAEVGMKFGDMSIFHHYGSGEVGASTAQPVFSAANLHEPGTFDLEKMSEGEFPGLALFMALPGPMEAEPAFDLMLDTGQRLAEILDAELRDETRSSLTPQSIAHLRERLGDFRRRQLLQAR